MRRRRPGELVFEWAYRNLGSTTQGSWQGVDLVGGDRIAWQRKLGQNRDQIANMTEYSDWPTPTASLSRAA